MNQDFSLNNAQEVIILESENISEKLKAEIISSFPWLQFKKCPEGLGYYELKNYGAKLVSADVIIFCDVDCQYEPVWLRSILKSFVDQNDVQIVAGDTAIPVTNAYSMATAMNYCIHRQKNKRELYPTSSYLLNNVAFRRELLLEHPIPEDVPIFRGKCSLHSRMLTKQGYIIWKCPSAKGYHAPPNGFKHYFWRYLVMGHDNYWLDRYLSQLKKQKSSLNSFNTSKSSELLLNNQPQEISKTNNKPKSLVQRINNRLGYLRHQTSIYLGEQPELKKYIPFALPIVVLTQTIIFMGRLITSKYPHLLLKSYLAQFEPAYGKQVFSQPFKQTLVLDELGSKLTQNNRENVHI